MSDDVDEGDADNPFDSEGKGVAHVFATTSPNNIKNSTTFAGPLLVALKCSAKLMSPRRTGLFRGWTTY
ncbi:BZ3500_MvSof-1268-A1-R1_Chr4-4g07502 [Microbotryum saponariae]|uniref:BZ3500_MvSof-1268-A1-R1_Chr4-4g07502 protein n=1 Tax=Microbotryum saponariae TaxID=289078 RepID=A0A2X0M560_9BASI|nr:BZ3500_MvSof-1268-A1-R1_Chr4-4g07502 [Microbotryum saponariae]SDA07163.1 BZ3501_MvSof-1269-A2-R1_Chr4-3g07210 [Microbotryum saponariae]